MCRALAQLEPVSYRQGWERQLSTCVMVEYSNFSFCMFSHHEWVLSAPFLDNTWAFRYAHCWSTCMWTENNGVREKWVDQMVWPAHGCIEARSWRTRYRFVIAEVPVNMGKLSLHDLKFLKSSFADLVWEIPSKFHQNDKSARKATSFVKVCKILRNYLQQFFETKICNKF